MKIFRLLTTAGLAAVIVAGTAMAATPVENAIKARKAQMQLHSFNLGPLGAMAKGDMPYDAAKASAAAHNLAALASLDVTAYLLEGSDNGTAPDTRALPAIWSDMDGFKARWSAFKIAADAMDAAAGKDLGSLQGAMAGLGGACGACHKAYRAE